MEFSFIFCEPSLYLFLENLYLTVLRINSSLLISHGIRRNRKAYIIIKDLGKALIIDGKYVRNYRPDFQSASGLLLKVLLKGDERRGLRTIPLKALENSILRNTTIYHVVEGENLTMPKILNDKVVIIFPSVKKFKCLRNIGHNEIVIPYASTLLEHQMATIVNTLLDEASVG